MDFYIDESGAFSIPTGVMQHNACVAVCVVVSDLNKNNLQKDFESFCFNLPNDAFVKGEPKGSMLKNDKKLEFCEVLLKYKENLLIIPVTIDMQLIAMHYNEQNINERLYDRCIALCDYMQHESMKEELRLLASQWKNMSYQDFLKIACYAYALFKSIRHSILTLSTNGNEVCWDAIKIEIDRSNQKPDSREKQIFSKMLGMWFEAWSRKKPFTLIKEIHTPQHPIVKNFDTPDGIDGRKLIQDIDWGDSKNSWGLRIADIACNIVSNAVNDIENEFDSFRPFCDLMKLSTYGYMDGPGLFSPFKMTEEENNLFRVKYKKLSEEMRESGFKANHYGEVVDRLDPEISGE